jgi:nitroreductase
VFRSFGPLAVRFPPVATFDDVLRSRRSIRSMRPAPLRTVANLLAYATCVTAELVGDPLGRTRRPTPSAGALHPVEIVLVHGGGPRLFRCEPGSGVLQLLAPADRRALGALSARVRSIVPEADGSLLVFLADASKTAAAYEHSLSLVWRDAGALLQTVHLSAAAFGLAFCPLGILGSEVASALFPDATMRAVGMAVVGRPVSR